MTSVDFLPPHPFGTEITLDQLARRFTQHQHWEDRYRELIRLSRHFPPLDPQWRRPEYEITGCENRVWLASKLQLDGTLHFFGDSEGRIVKGLIAVLLTVCEGQSHDALLSRDLLDCFEPLGLRQQLSASRQSGLQALAAAITQAAQQATV